MVWIGTQGLHIALYFFILVNMCYLLCIFKLVFLYMLFCQHFGHTAWPSIMITYFTTGNPHMLTLILLTWTIWRAPANASKWRMGFNPYPANVDNMASSFQC